MKLVIEVKKTTFTTKTKNQLASKVNNFKACQHSARTVSGIELLNTDVDNGNVIFITKFQKQNKKTVQKKRKDAKSEFGKRTVSTIVRTPQWTCNCYEIPIMLLKQHNIKKVKVDQNGFGTTLTTHSGRHLNHRFEEISIIQLKK